MRCSSTRPRGKLARRPELDKALLSANRAGDQLVVTKLDRLGRSLEHLIDLSNALQTRGVDLVVLDQGIDTSTAVGRMFFQILGAIAEFEHALMSERTMRRAGRRPCPRPHRRAETQARAAAGRARAADVRRVGEDGKRRTPSNRSPPSSASPGPRSTATSPLPQRNCRHGKPIRRRHRSVSMSAWWVDQNCHHERHRSSSPAGPAVIGTRWHDTPTSKPPASQPNSTSADTVTRRR